MALDLPQPIECVSLAVCQHCKQLTTLRKLSVVQSAHGCGY